MTRILDTTLIFLKKYDTVKESEICLLQLRISKGQWTHVTSRKFKDKMARPLDDVVVLLQDRETKNEYCILIYTFCNINNS